MTKDIQELIKKIDTVDNEEINQDLIDTIIKKSNIGYSTTYNYDEMLQDYVVMIMKDINKKVRCNLCKAIVYIEDMQQHHISYKKNKTIELCYKCHNRIRRNNYKDYPEFKPDMTRNEYLKQINDIDKEKSNIVTITDYIEYLKKHNLEMTDY